MLLEVCLEGSKFIVGSRVTDAKQKSLSFPQVFTYISYGDIRQLDKGLSDSLQTSLFSMVQIISISNKMIRSRCNDTALR